MTFPRFRNGIPVTLGTLSPFRAMDGSTVIEPYPNYSWHENPTQDCLNKMVSGFRIAVSYRTWLMKKNSNLKSFIFDSRSTLVTVCGLSILVNLVCQHRLKYAHRKFLSLISTPINSSTATLFQGISTLTARFLLRQ